MGVPVAEPLASFLSRRPDSDSLRLGARDPVPPVRRVEHTQPLPKATAKVEHGVTGILDVTRDATVCGSKFQVIMAWLPPAAHPHMTVTA
jgi:hypothetical protein